MRALVVTLSRWAFCSGRFHPEYVRLSSTGCDGGLSIGVHGELKLEEDVTSCREAMNRKVIELQACMSLAYYRCMGNSPSGSLHIA